MSLCTLSELKTHLGIGVSDTEHNARLNTLIAGVSERLGRAAGRVYDGRACLEKADRVVLLDVPDYSMVHLWLPAYPVAEITEIKEALYGGFTDADALVVNTGYQLAAGSGRIIRIGYWLRGNQTVRVTYSGGYTRADAWVSGDDYTTGDVVRYGTAIYECTDDVTGGTTAPPDDDDHWEVATGEVALPDDVNNAAILQSSFWFQRRDKLGLTGAGVQGGSYSSYARDELLPEVRQVMHGYRRFLA